MRIRRQGALTVKLTYAVSVLVAAFGLSACAKTVDGFPQVTVYNGSFGAACVEVDSDGLDAMSVRLPALRNRVIAPGDECRFTVLEISTLKGEPIDSFEGSVCAGQSLVLGQDKTITFEE